MCVLQAEVDVDSRRMMPPPPERAAAAASGKYRAELSLSRGDYDSPSSSVSVNSAGPSSPPLYQQQQQQQQVPEPPTAYTI